MRFLSLMVKSVRENVREWGVLLLALLMPAIFIVICYFYFGSGVQTGRILVADLDKKARAQELIRDLENTKSSDFGINLSLSFVKDPAEGEARIRSGKADLLLVIPADFSSLVDRGMKPSVAVHADLMSSKYGFLAGIVYAVSTAYVSRTTGREPSLEFVEKPLRSAELMNSFDGTVPPILIFSLLTVLFTAAISFIREVEKGTIKRLRLSAVTAFEFLSAISVTQILVSLVCIAFTLALAWGLGYRTSGSILLVLLTGALCGLSVVSLGLIVSVFCGSVRDVMIIGNFPYFFLLFFSGIIPLPVVSLFKIGSVTVTPDHFFPMHYGILAMNRILNFGAGLGDILPELAAVLVLTLVYFAVGLGLFYRRHMRLA